MSDLRKIDALIAEHLYGEKGPWDLEWEYVSFALELPRQHLPTYSTDIALAIGVLEKLYADRQAGWSIEHFYIAGCRRVGISIGGNNGRYGENYEGIDLPEAICRHVLHMLGVKP